MAAGKILYKSLYWKILQFLTAFIINIVLARALQSTISADFYTLVYLFSLGISFFTLGLDISLNYYLSRKEISPGTARRIILCIIALALLICLSLLWIFYPFDNYHPAVPLPWLLFFAGFNIAGGLLTTLSGTLFTTYGQNHLIGKVGFFVNMVVLVCCVIISYVDSGPVLVISLFWVYFLFSFLQGLFLFILSMRLYSSRSLQSPIPLPLTTTATAEIPTSTVTPLHILRFSFTAFLINFIFFAGTRFCIYLIPYRLTLSDQGNYIQAYKIVEYMSLVISIIYYPFIALVAGEGGEKMKSRVLLLVRISNTFVLISGIFILAIGGWLFPFVFGRSFDRMYGIFTGFLPGLFAVCSSTFFTAYYFGSGQMKYNFISACIQFACMPLFFFLFVRNGSATGAAFAFSVAVFGSLLYDLLVFRRVHPFAARDILVVNKKDWDTIRMLMR